MKTTKLIVGIITIVLSVIVLFQSCAAGLANAMEENEAVSGSAGAFLAICLLAGGIVGIVTRKSKGGSITAGCIYAVGGLLGIINAANFPDLIVWSVISFICAALFIISAFFLDRNVT